MWKRKLYFLTGPVLLALLICWGVAASVPAKEETVTLTITGMT